MLFGRVGRVWRQSLAQTVAGKLERLIESHVLITLVHEGAATQTEIALRTAQHPTAVSRMLDDLEARKLVRRQRDPKDRRKMRVESTSEGRAQVEAARPAMLKSCEEILRGLDERDRIALKNLLTKLLAATEDSKCAPSDDE